MEETESSVRNFIEVIRLHFVRSKLFSIFVWQEYGTCIHITCITYTKIHLYSESDSQSKFIFFLNSLTESVFMQHFSLYVPHIFSIEISIHISHFFDVFYLEFSIFFLSGMEVKIQNYLLACFTVSFLINFR